MNGKKILNSLGNVDMAYVEAAAYPEKRKRAFHLTKMTAAAACLALLLSVGAIAYATGSVDALKSYFMAQNEKAEALLREGTLRTTDGRTEMRVDNYIADADEFIFTVSLVGTGKTLTTGEALETVWISNSGERISAYNKEYGAYTVEKGRGIGFVAHADSMYPDADATFIVINDVPDGYRIEDMKAVEVSCMGLTMEVGVGDSVAVTYTLSAADTGGKITDLTASAIGFGFTSESSEIGEICLIKPDGTYAKGDGKSDADGFYGYRMSARSLGESGLYAIRGQWNGEGAISTGILDLSRYIGMRIGDTDYYINNK